MSLDVAQVRRQLRGLGGNTLRRLGWLPAGTPDGLGQDAALVGRTFRQRVFVYFAGTRQNLYQLRQWYEPLRALDERLGVLVVCADSRVARVVAREQPLPVVTVGRSATIDSMAAASDTALFCYVGHDVGNFNALRIPSALHAFLSHGESDKRVSASNLVKAYDYAFVAGQAAVDRFARRLMRYDPAGHVVAVGRPQLDGLVTGPRARGEGDPVVVLYAPTWEGGQGSSAYSSVVSHGERVVHELLADPRVRVVYRPHPRTGVSDARYAAADERIRRAVASAGDGSRVDTGADPYRAFDRADVMVTDVSAIAYDWLATGRPLVVTVPGGEADVEPTALLDSVPRLAADGVAGLADRLVAEVRDDPRADERARLVEHYFGTVGTATERFVAQCERVVAERDQLRAAHADRGQE